MTETEAEAIRLLRDLVQQIEINDFMDSHGHDAHRLKPYVEAQRFLAERAKRACGKPWDVLSRSQGTGPGTRE